MSQKPAGICDRTDAGFSTATSAQTLGASNDAQIVSGDYCCCTSGVVCYVGEGLCLLKYLCTYLYVGEERFLFTYLYLIVFVMSQNCTQAGFMCCSRSPDRRNRHCTPAGSICILVVCTCFNIRGLITYVCLSVVGQVN